MHNFKVAKNELTQKACDNNKKRLFLCGTSLKEWFIAGFRTSEYQFTTFGNILDGKHITDLLLGNQ